MDSAHSPEIVIIDERSKFGLGIFKMGDVTYTCLVYFGLTKFYLLRGIAGAWFSIKSIIHLNAAMVFHE